MILMLKLLKSLPASMSLSSKLKSHSLLHAPVRQPGNLSPFPPEDNFLGTKTRNISGVFDDDTVRSGSTSCSIASEMGPYVSDAGLRKKTIISR